MCLIRGIGCKKNVERGFRLIRRGCAQNIGGSYTVLGDCYRYGYVVDKNIEKALDSYKRTIEINDMHVPIVRSHCSIAEMYEKGEGVPQSFQTSAYYYMHAADRHSSEAQWKVGNMFENGNGVDLDIDRAVMYFKLSARGGNEDAHLKVETYLVGQGVEHPRVSLVKSIEEVAAAGDSTAKKLVRKWRSRLRRMKST